MKTGLQLAGTSLIGLGVFGLLLFLPAGTLNYWQAWVLIAVFMVCTLVPSVYLLMKSPSALQRRMHAGPAAETRLTQRIVITAAFVLLPAMRCSARSTTASGGRRCRLRCHCSAMRWWRSDSASANSS